MDDLPLQKVTIPGPTLASLIQRFSSALGDTDGLLFGHVSYITPSSLSDDADDSTSTSSLASSFLVATITGFISSGTTSSFYDSSGNLDVNALRRLHLHLSPNHYLIGWFSARHRSSLRPSLREFCVSQSLSTKPQFAFSVQNSSSTFPPCIFLLLTTPFPDHQNLIHTHAYRAYQFRSSFSSFDAKSLDIVNIGPAFRGHYSAFCPNSQLPHLPCEFRGSPMKEDGKKLSHMKNTRESQNQLDLYVEGFNVESLGKLMGSQAANYIGELEGLYEKMLSKLDSLARAVEISSAKVLEQENHNMKLRYKAAGLE